MAGKDQRPPSNKTETFDPNDFITEEQALLDGYLSGQLTLDQFWTDDGLDRFHIDPLKNLLDQVLWAQLTKGQYDQLWWGRFNRLVDHATMAEVDKLEKAERGVREFQRDWHRFRTNLRRTGGCLMWDQLAAMAAYSRWGGIERKFENGAVLSLGGLPAFRHSIRSRNSIREAS